MTSAIAQTMAEPLRAVTQGDQVVIPFHSNIIRVQHLHSLENAS